MTQSFCILLLLLGLSCVCAVIQSSNDNSSTIDTEINKTLSLLNEGERKVELNDEYKNITLVIGNTGSGKSTFIQWIAGDNAKLKSVLVGDDFDDEYIIVDGENRIGSSLRSKTKFPELVIDDETDTPYYDCPGFSDTRSASHDIATSFLIKKLTDHAENIKMVFVVSHSSVQIGVDRLDFMRFLTHVIDLIPNIEIYRDSIALVVTKVDRVYDKTEKIIRKIAKFIQENKQVFENELTSSDITDDKRKFYEKAINIMNILLTKKGEDYERIGIFRRPNEPGPLSEIALLQNGKPAIKLMINENLKFSPNVEGSFGYTISDKSKNVISALAEKINDDIWNNAKIIVGKLQSYHDELASLIVDKASLLVENEKKSITETKTEAHLLFDNFESGYETVLRLVKHMKNVSDVEEIAFEIKSALDNLKINSCEESIESISANGKYLNFLQVVFDREIAIYHFVDLFNPIKHDFIESRIRIEEIVKTAAFKINDKINNEIKYILKEVEDVYLDKMETVEIENIKFELNQANLVLSNLKQDILNLNDSTKLSETIDRSLTKLQISNSAVKDSILSVSTYGEKFELLITFMGGQLSINTSGRAEPIDAIINVFAKSEKWLAFLEHLYNELSGYEIQKDTGIYNVANIENWGKSGNLQGIEITKRNLKLFLEKLNQQNILDDYSLIDATDINEIQIKMLNRLLSSTLKNKIESQCSEEGELTISGDYVKFSDFTDDYKNFKDLCENGNNVNSVNIFASKTVFIDRDVQAVGKKIQFSIVAPKWEIVGDRKINLDGSQGGSFQGKAQNGLCEGCGGADGRPGLAGGLAGNFLGIGYEFDNITNLTITLNGGNGGSGQDGGNGREGNKGSRGTENLCELNTRAKREVFTATVIATGAIALFGYLFYPKTNVYICTGSPGGIGGAGGDGGAAGLAGYRGHSRLIMLNESQDFPIIQNDLATQGHDGRGGEGALGGLYGDDMLKKCKEAYVMNYSCDIEFGRSFLRSPSGSDGYAGNNYSGRRQPEDANEFQDVAYITNSYKKYLQFNTNNTFKRHTLNEFSKLMDRNIDLE